MQRSLWWVEADVSEGLSSWTVRQQGSREHMSSGRQHDRIRGLTQNDQRETKLRWLGRAGRQTGAQLILQLLSSTIYVTSLVRFVENRPIDALWVLGCCPLFSGLQLISLSLWITFFRKHLQYPASQMGLFLVYHCDLNIFGFFWNSNVNIGNDKWNTGHFEPS